MKTVPGFHIEAELGRGRSAVVYRALHLGAGRRVALKIARRSQLAKISHTADFSAEFGTLSALAPSDAVQVVSHGVTGDYAYLAMEVAEGGSILRLSGLAATGKALALVQQVAGALGRLHDSGWVHRDVKPSNILLRGDGSLVLADFGCACRQGDGGSMQKGRVMGTPVYAAPEQSNGAPAHPSADIYSLGILFYEILTGQPPFPGETLTELFCQHQMAPIPRLPIDQSRLQDLLDAMLAKAPEARPQDGHAVQRELQALRKGLT